FEDGMVDTERYVLTAQAKEEYLSQFIPRRRKNKTASETGLRRSKDIKGKNLFYNSTVLKQINQLKSLLSHEGLKDVQARLTECGLRRGIACLFYGAPGTGKTESVLQLARMTGRDVMQINIAGLRDKYVGESEKNIKAIFDRYRHICKSCEHTPILLFNEADAIINSRFETTSSSVEKMDNAMQNIILQELENLDGILIATTNLTGLIDTAFDRRFLFKVEFTKPDRDTRNSIWHSMLPDISDADCRTLAEDFDFSGGQIENIARKSKIDYVISGQKPSIDRLKEFCNEERVNRTTHTKIGF
ncbi:MAG: ATP-binding protein, partial [Duncaniella sp.]|nr:ATP-binding protein [Duncaniella sp.]